MSFSYDPASDAGLDVVRWLVADTDATDPLQHDEEITRVLSGQPNTYRAAATVARQIARQFARQCDLDIAREVRISLSDRSKNYFTLAKDLEDQANKAIGGGGVGAYAGGISVADKQAADANQDRVRPAFTRESMGTRTERTWAEEGPP